MAKVSDEAKKIYYEKISEHKKKVEELLEAEKQILHMVSDEETAGGYRRLSLAEINLNMISYYVLMNNLSFSLLGVKNENALNDARKLCYKSLIYLEEIFTDLIDIPYGDYEQGVLSVTDYPELQKYKIVRKLGLNIQQVSEAFGENSKWKWSMTELEGRLATISKNCMDLKKVVVGMDPRAENYRERIQHFNLTKQLLDKAAENYRLKYELSTGRMDDFRIAINYLGALKRLLILTNRVKDIEDLKRKIDIWKTKMEKDLKLKEKKAIAEKLKRD